MKHHTAPTASSFIPPAFIEMVDVAECALDEHLELLQRQLAAASRAAARARCEAEQLESRDDIHPHTLAIVRRQRSAAEIRCQHLMRAIDELEARGVDLAVE
jgi:septal ring factor EnvC (AmiA/AmiB activator)